MDTPDGTAQLGVRPEDLVLGEAGARARVLTVENLGVETVVLLDLGEGQRAHALLRAGQSIAADGEIGVTLRLDSALFFGADGARIGGAEAKAPTLAEGESRHAG